MEDAPNPQVGLDQKVWLVLGISARGQMLSLTHSEKTGLGTDLGSRKAEKSHGVGKRADCLGPFLSGGGGAAVCFLFLDELLT